jgi:pimeloyl-ACP methyl ester carboxylesterase
VNQQTLSDEMLDAFANEHIATALRWQRLRRFFKGQLDPDNERLTQEAVPAMRRFTKPVLILWGQKDTNFGPDIAIRLARDVPGTKGVAWMRSSAHLPMLEQPQAYADAADRFFASGTASKDAAANLGKIRRGMP